MLSAIFALSIKGAESRGKFRHFLFFVYIRQKICYTAIRMEGTYMTLSPRFHKIYAFVTGTAAGIAGVCLMVACVGIWGAGDTPFSPGSVQAAFTPISVPVYLCLALVLGGMVLDTISPSAKEQLRAPRQVYVLLKRQLQKSDLRICGPALSKDIQTQKQRMRRCAILNAVIPGLLALIFLGYALNPGNFVTEDPTGSVIRAMYILLPCLAAALVCCLVLRNMLLNAAEKLIVLLKQAPQCVGGSPAPVKKNWIPMLRCLLIVAAIAMIAYGSLSGGTTDVLAKAVNICTECVGLG